MLTYILRRVLYSVPVLVLSSFLSFTFVSLAGDPRQNLLANPKLSQITYKHLFHEYHLDASIPQRYWYWVHDALLHKLGSSLATSQPIWPDLQRVLGHTAQLVVLADALALVLGLAVGIFSAIWQYSAFDYVFTSVSFLGLAIPAFWLALLLQTLFVDIYLKWHIRIFYTSGLNSHGNSTWSFDRLQHIALPALTLTAVSFAVYSRFMRAAMLDVISSDYVRTARAKGLPEYRVIMRHVFRNALIPIVTVMALRAGDVLGGAIITETVFNLDGMGLYFINSLTTGETYSVMAWLLIVSVMVVFFNLLADVILGFLDPRIRLD